MTVADELGEPVTLRDATDADEAFLRKVYASTRAAELGLVDWDDATKDAFLRQQFDAQRQWYDRTMPDCSREVIQVGDQPAGRLYLDERSSETCIVDIAVLPEFQGRGVGSSLLATIVERAAGRGASVSLHVEVNNPALGWYTRRDFVVEEDLGVHLRLRWRAPDDNRAPLA